MEPHMAKNRRLSKVPGYVLHRATGQAVVRINGKDHYLGKHGTPASHEAYERLLIQWRLQKVDQLQHANSIEIPDITVEEFLLAYMRHAQEYYRDRRTGKPTSELADMKYALRPLRRLYGRSSIRAFGPLALKTVREDMIRQGWSRGVVNARVNRIKRVFRWGVAEQLVPESVLGGLRAVDGLRRGRTQAREAEDVKPVPPDIVEATLPFLSRQVAAMVRLQWLTGMRPGEVVQMRPCDIDRTGETWSYSPERHKNEWREERRVVHLGPQAQEIVRPFLDRPDDAYLFSPEEAEAERNASRRGARKSPMTPSQTARKPKVRPGRAKRTHYDRDSYRRAIAYAIQKANRSRSRAAAAQNSQPVEIPLWCPLQLRHLAATEIRAKYGVEGAQHLLGHARADVTQVYAERNTEFARRIAKESG